MFGMMWSIGGILAASITLKTVLCVHIFFHEPSAILLKPEDKNPRSDFGFSLGHWNGHLIVGSPRSDFIGKVYDCPLNGISDTTSECSAINIAMNDTSTSNSYSLDINPNQNFFLGSSISTTKDYVFTCAPLVTKKINNPYEKREEKDAIGSCFLYDGKSTVYKDPLEEFSAGDDSRDFGFLGGGIGWTTYANEETAFLLIAKTSVAGDIYYYSEKSNPSNKITSISKDATDQYYKTYWNVGYAITAGKFFSNKIVYAVSLQTRAMTTGKIIFIEIIETKFRRRGEVKTRSKLSLMEDMEVDSPIVGAMFGYSMTAADFTQDGFSELLVGAPLESEDCNELEYGVVHIYLGGSIESLNNRKKMRSIIGAKPRGRFGTTIAARDIDGDNIPEIFVSAPYEDTGVVYVLSGYDLKNLMASGSSSTVQVSKLQNSQQVARGDLRQLGFSLQVLPDVDGNGCDDLAIGAPGSATVMLLRCIPTVQVVVTLQPKDNHGTDIRIEDTKFEVTACVTVTNMTGSDVTGVITVTTAVDNALIKDPSFTVDLSESKRCQNVLVEGLQPGYVGEYVLKANAKLEDTMSTSLKDFEKSRAKLSINSKTESQLTVMRQCVVGEDCTPHLSLSLGWKSKPDSSASNVYKVESSSSETVCITVKNVGKVTTSGRCVGVEVAGAQVSSADSCHSKPGYIECSTLSTLTPNEMSTFDIVLDMSRISSSSKELVVTAKLYESCEQKQKVEQEELLSIEYQFDQAWKRVQLVGANHEKLITDIELLASQNKEENQKDSTFVDSHEYLITYDGNVTWANVNAVIEVEDRPFITNVTLDKGCTSSVDSPLFINCRLTILPQTTTKVVVAVVMAGKEIGSAFKDTKKIDVSSRLHLYYSERYAVEEKIEQVLVTNIKLVKDISFRNKPILIAIVAAILALLVLAVVTFCLYKRGFFKREKKEKLNVLRESIRKRSIRLASERSIRYSQKSPSNADCDDHIDMEVLEDSPFEEIPIDTNSGVVLVESQTHNVKDKVNKLKEQ